MIVGIWDMRCLWAWILRSNPLLTGTYDVDKAERIFRRYQPQIERAEYRVWGRKGEVTCVPR